MAVEVKEKFKVGILGATGMVGQRFISLLENHPWFTVTMVAASPRSAGKTYAEAVGDRWKMTDPMPERVAKLVVRNVNEVEAVAAEVDFVFSAVDMTKDEIRAIEDAYAKTETPVVSNNSAHRWTPDVPMVVPELNPQHYDIIPFQRKRLGTTKGFVAVKPNCSIQSYTPMLHALREFEPYEIVATTYQAISGAGKTFKDWPEMIDNVIPYIGGEEEKSEQEPLRIWGKIENGEIVKADGPVITTQCIRVPVSDGHTAAVFVKFKKKPTTSKRTTVRRPLWTATSKAAWPFRQDVFARIRFTTGSSSDSLTTRSAAPQAEQSFPQRRLSPSDTLRRSKKNIRKPGRLCPVFCCICLS